jgi:tRNA(fMet)-specific endonuclease VapC
MVAPTILDTDILSALMRRQPSVVSRSRAYLVDHPQLSCSVITRYEILRGLKAQAHAKRIEAFTAFCQTCELLSLTEQVVATAADIYADLYRRGQLIGDVDILIIAATAICNGRILATNNQSHFERVAGLRIDNWLA